jgi:sensor histidine kinase YesM
MKFGSDDRFRFQIRRIATHFLFWAVILSGYTILYGYSSQGAYRQAFILLISTLPIYMGSTYYSMNHLLPQFLFKRDYKGFTLRFIYTSLLAIFLELLVIMFVFVMPFRSYGLPGGEINSIRIDIPFLMVGIYLVILLGTTIKLLKHWYTAQQRNRKLTQASLEAELKMLKSQVHPHFLFNTLNSLYALTLKKSDEAPEAVLKLAGLMRYLLYDCKADFVTLAQEFQMLNDYVSLEWLRYAGRLKIELKLDDPDPQLQLAPMIILPFIENSFKHGASQQIRQPWIQVEARVTNRHLKLRVENSKPVASTPDLQNSREGVGLKNVQRRLDLCYPGLYRLTVENQQDRYKVELEVPLSVNIEGQK